MLVPLPRVHHFAMSSPRRRVAAKAYSPFPRSPRLAPPAQARTAAMAWGTRRYANDGPGSASLAELFPATVQTLNPIQKPLRVDEGKDGLTGASTVAGARVVAVAASALRGGWIGAARASRRCCRWCGSGAGPRAVYGVRSRRRRGIGRRTYAADAIGCRLRRCSVGAVPARVGPSP